MEALLDRWPGRAEVIMDLVQLFGAAEDYVPPLFVFGHSGTGKTSVVRDVLQTFNLPHAFVNLVECYSRRLVYETALVQLFRSFSRAGQGSGPVPIEKRCESTSKFLARLKLLCRRNETTYLVFDRAERLRTLDPYILQVLFRAPELTDLNLCVILITDIPWDKFQTSTGSVEPVPVFFAEYSKQDMVAILSRELPPGEDDREFFHAFVNTVVEVFLAPCRDLVELRHIVNLLFPKYKEPVLNGTATKRDFGRLFSTIRPLLQQFFSKIYMRDSVSGEGSVSMTEVGLETELPLYSKFLLLSAFMASYNPANTDTHYFSQLYGRNTKRVRKNQAAPKNKDAMAGPGTFPLERLFAIFQTLVEDPEPISVDIYSQVATLVALNLLVPVGECFDRPKFKCNLTYDQACKIAENVQCSLQRYLCPRA